MYIVNAIMKNIIDMKIDTKFVSSKKILVIMIHNKYKMNNIIIY